MEVFFCSMYNNSSKGIIIITQPSIKKFILIINYITSNIIQPSILHNSHNQYKENIGIK